MKTRRLTAETNDGRVETRTTHRPYTHVGTQVLHQTILPSGTIRWTTYLRPNLPQQHVTTRRRPRHIRRGNTDAD